MDQFISEMLNNGQINPILIAPVLLVVVGVILVFVFGFKKPVEPQFKKLSASDSSKKSRRKDKSQKPTQNGNAVVSSQEKFNELKKKENVQQEKPIQQKNVVAAAVTKKDKSPKKSEEKKLAPVSPVKQKQTPKKEKLQPKKSIENDGGEWMTVTKDKKKRIEEIPQISIKKSEKTPSSTNEKSKKKEAQKQSVIKPKREIPEVEAKNLVNIEIEKFENKEVVTTSEQDIDVSVPTVTSSVEPTQAFETPTTANPSDTNTITMPIQVEENLGPSLETNLDVEQQEIKVDVRFTPGNNVVFDELGDAWTEAKVPRKRKSRKE